VIGESIYGGISKAEFSFLSLAK